MENLARQAMRFSPVAASQRKLLVAALATSVLLAMVPAASAQGFPPPPPGGAPGFGGPPASPGFAPPPPVAGPGYVKRRRGYDGGAAAAGVVGGLALGALAAGAYNSRPAPVYQDDDSDCYTQKRRVWDGYRYVTRFVEVCE